MCVSVCHRAQGILQSVDRLSWHLLQNLQAQVHAAALSTLFSIIYTSYPAPCWLSLAMAGAD
jgi:hypothetical protein